MLDVRSANTRTPAPALLDGGSFRVRAALFGAAWRWVARRFNATSQAERLELGIFFIRWAGIAAMFPTVLLLPLNDTLRRELLGVVSFAALFNASVPLLLKYAPEALVPVMSLCDATAAVAYVWISGFDSQAYFALFWVATSTALRLGLTATLSQLAVVFGLDLAGGLIHGVFSPGAWLFRSVCLGMMGSLAALLFDYGKRANERLRLANLQLVELSEAQTNFLNNASHELRTPLSAIKSFAELLLDETGLTSDGREFVGIVGSEADRLTRLVADLLDLGRIHAQGFGWRTESFDLREELQGLLRTHEPLATAKGLELRLLVSAELPRVQANRDAIHQVLVNLIGNAIKFTEAGYVRLRAAGDGEAVIIAVEDSGPGISPEDQQHIFERFYRSPALLHEGAPKGTGLGLAICHDIVEQHGSRIVVSSTPGRGTTFSFSLAAAG